MVNYGRMLRGVEVAALLWEWPTETGLDTKISLRSRGTDSDEVIATRLRNARHEVGFAHRYRYWIVNDELDAAVHRMNAVITAEECRSEAFRRPPLD